MFECAAIWAGHVAKVALHAWNAALDEQLKSWLDLAELALAFGLPLQWAGVIVCAIGFVLTLM